MSLNQSLIKSVNSLVSEFVQTISVKYNLNREELMKLWDSENQAAPTKSNNELTNIDMADLSFERLNKCNKQELVALCKSRKQKCTGTKQELMQRLLGGEENSSEKKKAEPQENKPAPAKKSSPKQPTSRASSSLSVVKKLTSDIPVLAIRRNAHDNLEHPETGLVFDRQTHIVIGKQQADGTIAELTDADIESCKRFKFKFNIPTDLDKKLNLNNVKIDELGDDEVLENIEDEEEDEEVLEEDEDEEVLEEDEEVLEEDDD
jgi:hypothetical protein